MSFTYVQSTGASSGTSAISSLAPAYGSNVAAGNLLIAYAMTEIIGGLTPAAISTVTDTLGNTWAPVNTGTNPFFVPATNIAVQQAWWCIANGSGANTVTVTTSVATARFKVAIAEFSFAAKSFIAVDTMMALSAAYTVQTATAVPPTLWMVGNCLALAAANQQTTSAAAWTAGTGYTSLYNSTFSSGTNTSGFMVQYAVNLTNASGPTLTQGGTVFWRASSCAFREVAYSHAITGPTSGAASIASLPFTITPNAVLTDTITFSDGAAGGTFTPSSITFSGSATPQTFTYTPAGGFSTYVTLTLSSSAGYVLYDATRTYTSSALQYYVATAGSDSNNGTSSSTPWQTIAHALSTITVPGVTLNLNGGDTFTTNLLLTQGITIQSYGTGQATIAGGSTATTAAIRWTNCDNIVINNLILTQGGVAGTSTEPNGVVIGYGTDSTRRSNGITITNNTISGGNNGIELYQSTTGFGGWNNITITGNTVSSCVTEGIVLKGLQTGSNHYSGLTCNSNVVHDITGDNSGTRNNGHGIVCSNVDGIFAKNQMSYNLVYSCGYSRGASVAGGPGGIFPTYSEWVTMIGNVVHNISATTDHIDGIGMDIDVNCKNCTVSGCFTYNNDGPGLLAFSSASGSQPHVYSFNISVNDATVHSGSIYDNGTGNFNIYNNTVVAEGANPAYYHEVNTTWSGTKLFNNILISASSVPSASIGGSPTAPVFDMEGNAYLSGTSSFLTKFGATTYSTLAAWRTATGCEVSPHGFALASNPLHSVTIPTITPQTLIAASGFALVAGSPLLAAGLDLLNLYGINPGSVDFLGTAIVAPYSVGAINLQWQPGPPRFYPIVMQEFPIMYQEQ